MQINLISVIAVAVGVLAVFIARQPDNFTVTRSAKIDAPPDKVFAQVNTLKLWNAWSPWARLDSKAETTFTGPESGTGSAMRWVSQNNQVGIGTMTITDSKPNESVQFRLDFEKPFKGTNTAEFTFKAEGNQTVVVWTMNGSKNFIAKVMGLVFNCDKIVGGMFENGLSNLNEVVQKS